MNQDISLMIGADIADQKIDVCIINRETGEEVLNKVIPNTSHGHKEFIKYISEYSSAFVVMEATGNYHKRFAAELDAAQIPMAILNPLVLKRYAQMKMIRTKTDKIDAITIARFGKEQSPAKYVVPSEAQEQLKALITVLDNLVKQKTQSTNLLHSQLLLPHGNPEGNKAIKRVLLSLNKQIERLEAELQKMVQKNFSVLYKKILSIKGIGAKTAQAAIAYLGDLTSFNSHKQVSAFIGLSPSIKESGSSVRKRGGISKQGNSKLRTLFYMASLSAVKYNKRCKELYIRLLKKGKRPMVSLIAVANKLIKQLFAIVKKNEFYKDDYIHPNYA